MFSKIIRHSITAAAFLTSVLCIDFACAGPAPALQANRPPVIQQVIGMWEWAPQSEGQLTCIALDEDGDTIEYEWVADNGTISGDGPTVTWTSPSVMGNYKIRVTVSDGKGGQATAIHEAKVIINENGSASADGPVVLKMSLPSSEVVKATKRMRIWTAAPIECVVDGANTKNLRFKWSAGSGRLQAASGMSLSDGTASKVNWISPGVGGEFKVDVVVTDVNGNEAAGTVVFDVFCCSNE